MNTRVIGVSHPLFRLSLQDAVGEHCKLTLLPEAAGQRYSGVVAGLERGRPVLDSTTPVTQAPGWPIQVIVPSQGLLFESIIADQAGDSRLLLAPPFWLMGPERRSAERVAVQVPLRFSIAGQYGWHSGTTENLSLAGLGLRSNVSVQTGAQLLLRIPLPGIPLPLVIQARCIRSAPEGDLFLAGIEFTELSFQSERHLARLLEASATQ